MNMIKPNVRFAEENDLSEITSILNQIIKNQPSTKCITPFTIEQREPWF